MSNRQGNSYPTHTSGSTRLGLCLPALISLTHTHTHTVTSQSGTHTPGGKHAACFKLPQHSLDCASTHEREGEEGEDWQGKSSFNLIAIKRRK